MITTKPAPASRGSVLRQSRLSCLHASDELIRRGHGPDPADLACNDEISRTDCGSCQYL